MILNALATYYQRLREDPNINIASPGFERKIIDFLLVINESGEFIGLRDLREGKGKKRKGRTTLVPKSVKRSSGIVANLLWDTAPYVLGKALPVQDQDKAEKRSKEQHHAFVKKIQETFDGYGGTGIQAVLRFLRNGNFDPIFQHSEWKEIEENGGNISFILSEAQEMVCQDSDVVSLLKNREKPKGETQICSIRGVEDVPTNLHTAIKNVWGAQSSGANIVSFNCDSFCSFGKEQGHNAPIGQETEFFYTTALNYLLSSENQRMQVGDSSTVFWARDSCDLENSFHSFLAPKKGKESVNYGNIKALLSAVKSGIPPEEADLPFYILGLAPNASRISIRFWYEGNVKELKERIALHFQDLEMIRAPQDPEFLSLFQLLVSTATQNKSDNIPPNLGGEIARAVFFGTAYPRTIFVNAICRCKAEQRINFARVSIIKGFLKRNSRISYSNQKEVSMALDNTYENIGYVLGRLFAVLDRIQQEAQGRGLNKTIRDTYFGAAASSPLVTFKRLNDLAVHHLAKIRRSEKSTIWLEKLLGSVNDLIPKEGYPNILTLEDQGRFFIGYYHQGKIFSPKKECNGG